MIAKSKTLEERLPDLKVLSFIVDVQIGPLSEPVIYAMKERFEQLSRGIDISEISQVENVKWGRQGFRKLGKDPTKYRLSSEKLIRRIAKKENPPLVNNVVDIVNWLSVELQAPIGVYDFEKIDGEIYVDQGMESEVYDCLAGYSLNLQGLPLLRDFKGPFGAPVSDSIRTAVTEETKRVLICIFNFNPNDSNDEIKHVTEVFIKKFNGISV